jgi:hypothetical protein
MLRLAQLFTDDRANRRIHHRTIWLAFGATEAAAA